MPEICITWPTEKGCQALLPIPESRRNAIAERWDRSPRNTSYSSYGTIPIGYEPSTRRSSTRPVGVLDRFDDNDAESIRTNYSSWSAYRQATTELPVSNEEEGIRVDYGLRRLQYPRRIDQTERELSRLVPSRGTMGRASQTSHIPLRMSGTSNYSPAREPPTSSSRHRSGRSSSSRPNILHPSDLDWEHFDPEPRSRRSNSSRRYRLD